MLRQDNSVRRMDLELRIEFMGLNTEIYKLSNYQYCIYCKSADFPFEEMKKKFDREIRQVGTSVVVVDSKPAAYIKQLENIDMDDPVDSFRASVITEPELQEFVRGMFSEVEIVKIMTEPGKDFKVVIEVSEDTRDDVCCEMKRLLLIRDIGTDDIQIKKVKREEKFVTEKQSGASVGNWEVMNLSLNKQAQWASFEAEYWFDHAEKIYKGEICREKIPFYHREQKCCYMNCSVFDSMNIRKALLLYDVVYIEVPIEDRLVRFLERQSMTKKELIELAGMGKVILVSTNAESRYDMEMMNAVYKENPMGVIGRRAVNTLLAAYFSQMKDRYLSFYPEIEDVSRQMYQYGIKENHAEAVRLAKQLVWPIRAKAKSFGYLNSRGILALSQYGINELIVEQLERSKDDERKEKLLFEFCVNSHPIHLSMALNATYFPFQQKEKGSANCYTDYYVADIMERCLTFFWYGHRQFNEISRIRIQKANEQIKMFESGNEISVLHIASNADTYDTPKRFGNLIESLADLPLAERNKRIREYNNVLIEASEVKTKTSVLEWFVTGLDFVPKSPALSVFINLSNLIKKRLDECEAVLKKQERKEFKKKVNKVTENHGLKKRYTEKEWDDIYLLDRIHRVARLKCTGDLD